MSARMDFRIDSQYFTYQNAFMIAVPLAILGWLISTRRQQDARAKKEYASYDEIPRTILRQVASKKVLTDLSGNVDVAVIGSGIGALSSASLLSRCGYKVVVFEQHEVVGGSTHTFTHDGYEFDVGIHYVGCQLDQLSSPLRGMFDTLSDGKLEWCPLDKAYDVMYNSSTGERLEMTGDPSVNCKQILMHFPHLDPKALRRYHRACFWARNIAFLGMVFKALPPVFLRAMWPIYGPLYQYLCLRKTLTVMRKCGLPDDVIGALTYNYGDIGTPPGRCPFFMQAFLESHYEGGGFFPKGGSSSIAKTLVAAISRRGGHVFALSPVETILTEKTWFGRHYAVGVRVHGVDVMVKKFVVSDAGFNNTFGDLGTSSNIEKVPLVNDAEASAPQMAFLNESGGGSLRPSPAFFLFAVGLDASDKDLNLPAQNIWHFENWDHDEYLDRLLCESRWSDDLKDVPLVFLSNESAKDPDYPHRHPGKAAITMIAFARYDWVKVWSGTTSHHRGLAYEDMKLKLTRRLLDVLYHHFPQTKGHVAFTELGTPLTVNKYLGRQDGEIYNLDHTSDRFNTLGAQIALHPQTTVKNLYMTGQDVSCVSIMACTLSGYLAAGRASQSAMVHYSIPALWSSFRSTMASSQKASGNV